MAEFFKSTYKKLNMKNDGNKDMAPSVPAGSNKKNDGFWTKDDSDVPAIAQSAAAKANKPNDGKWTGKPTEAPAIAKSAAKKGSGR